MSDAQTNPKIIEDSTNAQPITRSEKEQIQATKDLSSGQKGGQQTMSVRVSSPFRTYFDGMVFSISGENDTGPFDILPKHHNFISLLKASTLTIRTENGEVQKIDISGGLMHVKADKVVVFLDI